jgi:hypothetical protein
MTQTTNETAAGNRKWAYPKKDKRKRKKKAKRKEGEKEKEKEETKTAGGSGRKMKNSARARRRLGNRDPGDRTFSPGPGKKKTPEQTRKPKGRRC